MNEAAPTTRVVGAAEVVFLVLLVPAKIAGGRMVARASATLP